jgi:hypothetical protein
MTAARVLYVVMLRAVFLFGLALLPLPAIAAATPAPSASPSAASTGVKDGGMITGKVTTVDYQRNVFGVDAGNRGRIDVWVMPSTSIQGKDSEYHTFTDLSRGMRVQILSSISDGKYVAQIIRIR